MTDVTAVRKIAFIICINLLENMECAIIVTVVDIVGRIEEKTESSLIICRL